MTVYKLLKYFQYNFVCKFGLFFDFFFFKKCFHRFTIYSYFFDIYTDVTENFVDLYSIIYDLNFSFRRPHLLNYRFVYRGKSRVKVLVMQSRLYKKNTLSINFLLSEIFFLFYQGIFLVF